jgi:hypothetical protein
VHIVRYHNGKKIKNNDAIYWDRLTVVWEATGRACENCLTNCRNGQEIPDVQKEWKKIDITTDWRLKVMDKTRNLKGDIHTVCKNEMGGFHSSIFSNLSIECYKEVYIKERNNEMYALGLSFCSRFVNYYEADGMMMLAAKQLRNIL